MVGIDDIVITGLGCITPIGHGRNSFWQGLSCGRCGTREILISDSGQPKLFGAPINDFDGKQYVVPRKALKLMGHEVQISYAAAHLAWEDAGLGSENLEPERVGVAFGSELMPGDIGDIIPAIRACSNGPLMDVDRWGKEFSKAIYPLWMLRYLPNMPPCHVAIAVDARGPNNTIAQDEISGLLALSEAINVIQRGDADLMIVGAVGARSGPTRLCYRLPGLYLEAAHTANFDQSAALPCSAAKFEGNSIALSTVSDSSDNYHSRAFDARRGGVVPGDAAVVLILEKRRHAVARKANLYGTVLSTASRCGRPTVPLCGSSSALAKAGNAALQAAGLSESDLACISAQGFSHRMLDRSEAQAIELIATQAPVTAYSSYFGTPGAASGLLNLVSGILATNSGRVLPTLGYSQPDSECPVNVCQKEFNVSSPYLMQLSFTMQGQAAVAIVDCQISG